LEKVYPPYLLPLQEEAVRNYGILNCGEDKEGRMQYAPTGRMDSRFRGNDIGRSGNDIKVSVNEEGRMQYAPTEGNDNIDSRFRGNDISGTGMTLAKPKLHYHNSFLLVDTARTPF